MSDWEESTDESQLVGPAYRGFADFYAAEYEAILTFAYVLCGSKELAEDLAQDAFAAAYLSWSKVGGYDVPRLWVRRVVANKSVSLFRRASAEARYLRRQRMPVSEPSHDSGAFHSDEIWNAVRSLPRRQAQTIALMYVDGLKLGEIASVLGCSKTTVATHLARAKTKLAKKLGTLEAVL